MSASAEGRNVSPSTRLGRLLTRLIFGESPQLRRVNLLGMPNPFQPWYLLSGGAAHLFFQLWTRWSAWGWRTCPRAGA